MRATPQSRGASPNNDALRLSLWSVKSPSVLPVLRKKSRLSLSCLLSQAVFVVPPAKNRLRSDSKTGGQLMPMNAGGNACLAWLRNSRSQCRMRPAAIVVPNKFVKDESQVPVIDRNQIIQTLTSDGPDEPLAISIGFRSPNRRSDRSHSKILQRRVE
jgi:hypothetical protein